jgi:hypothetical protein
LSLVGELPVVRRLAWQLLGVWAYSVHHATGSVALLWYAALYIMFSFIRHVHTVEP